MIADSARAEWFKLSRRPAIWVTIALLLALGVGIGYLVTYLLVTHLPPSQGASADIAALRTDLYPASLVRKSLANASTLDAVFALILGVLAQGSEYAWQTVKTAQTQLPGRLAITLGRLLAIALLILLTVLALYAGDALAASLIALADGRSTSLPPATVVAEGIGAEWLILWFMAIFGFGLATLFRQSAMAIGLGLAYVLLIENLAFGLLGPLGDPFQRIHDWLPIAGASDLQQSFGQAASVVGIEIGHGGEVDVTRAVLVLLLWAGGVAVLSGALVRFRDII